jgi:hypothetical protein
MAPNLSFIEELCKPYFSESTANQTPFRSREKGTVHVMTSTKITRELYQVCPSPILVVLHHEPTSPTNGLSGTAPWLFWTVGLTRLV